MTRKSTLLWVLLGSVYASGASAADETLRLEQVIARVLSTYPSLAVATLQVERARLEQDRVEAMLGWNLGAQAGVARDAGLFGGTVDRSDANAGLSRALKAGGSVGLNGSYVREESSTSLSPLLPNPSNTGRVDLSYRQPWARGAGNPDYRQGLRRAEAGVSLADAGEQGQRDQIARLVADLYFGAAFTQARVKSARDAIQRAERLQKYIRNNARLGLTEAKDLLQAEAQLRSQIAEERSLQTLWEQQRTTLNRLMGEPPEAEFTPVIAPPVESSATADEVVKEAAERSPEIRRAQARDLLAETGVELARDARRDRVDLVYSVGNRTRSGDTVAGTTSESDTVGGVRLEYSRPLSRRGVNATLTQAEIDRNIAREELRQAEEDLRYNAASLVRELDAAKIAAESAQARLDAERRKLDEAQQRYRRGRTDTARIIDFERDLSSAELAAQQQQIELARRHTAIAVLRGNLWDVVEKEGGK